LPPWIGRATPLPSSITCTCSARPTPTSASSPDKRRGAAPTQNAEVAVMLAAPVLPRYRLSPVSLLREPLRKGVFRTGPVFNSDRATTAR
jgi:hypothetical protein